MNATPIAAVILIVMLLVGCIAGSQNGWRVVKATSPDESSPVHTAATETFEMRTELAPPYRFLRGSYEGVFPPGNYVLIVEFPAAEGQATFRTSNGFNDTCSWTVPESGCRLALEVPTAISDPTGRESFFSIDGQLSGPVNVDVRLTRLT